MKRGLRKEHKLAQPYVDVMKDTNAVVAIPSWAKLDDHRLVKKKLNS